MFEFNKSKFFRTMSLKISLKTNYRLDMVNRFKAKILFKFINQYFYKPFRYNISALYGLR